MLLKWECGERVYEQNFNCKSLITEDRSSENSLFDCDIWFGINLLDIEAYRQYKAMRDVDNGVEYYSTIIDQYAKIEEIIKDAFADAALVFDIFYNSEDLYYIGYYTDFTFAFLDFVDQLIPYLHSRSSYPKKDIEVPESDREDISQQLAIIQRALSGEEIDSIEEDYKRRGNRRNPSIVRKDIIRKAIVEIAKIYSEVSLAQYQIFRAVCKRYKVPNIYSFDCAVMAMCPIRFQYRIHRNIEKCISKRIQEVFDKRLHMADFRTWLSQEKIQKIQDYFANRDYIRTGMTYYDEMNRKMRDYFRGRRCIAIMEFPVQTKISNMFALSGTELSGTELSGKKPKLNDEVVETIAKELALDNVFTYCKQNDLVRRYTHKEDNIHYPLSHWNYLKDHTEWKDNQQDYSCCERKIIAQLEKDNLLSALFGHEVGLWARFPVCQNCWRALLHCEYGFGFRFISFAPAE